MGVSSCWEWTGVERSSIFKKPAKAPSISRVPEYLGTFFLRGLGFECLMGYTGLLQNQINIGRQSSRVHINYTLCPLDWWNRDRDWSGILSIKPMAWADWIIKFQSWLTATICTTDIAVPSNVFYDRYENCSYQEIIHNLWKWFHNLCWQYKLCHLMAMIKNIVCKIFLQYRISARIVKIYMAMFFVIL